MPDSQRLIDLALGKGPVFSGDRGEHLGVEFDLAKRYIIVNTKIDLHGDRVHLLGGSAAC